MIAWLSKLFLFQSNAAIEPINEAGLTFQPKLSSTPTKIEFNPENVVTLLQKLTSVELVAKFQENLPYLRDLLSKKVRKVIIITESLTFLTEAWPSLY